DKAFLKIGGNPIIRRQLGVLRNIFKKIIVVTNSPDHYKHFKNIKIISDVVRDKGPIGGIYSGLIASDAFHNFVVACDMPFMDAKLIKYLITLKNGFDIVVPSIEGKYETLFAIYSKNCIKPICEALENNNLSMKGLLNKVRVKEITRDEIIKFGDANAMFMNVNTKDDLCRTLAC
ncbi:MAG: molybdenum cofactor guanylyltransferase, partial [Candidatus Omnitrophica bacterium]|nr:molybdenum cofactor guanylyltransferase [Candidatus Omnitrophota bacterium]